MSYYDMSSSSRDDAVRAFEGARTAVEEMRGNQGGMLLVDPDSGKAITITLWESEEALQESTEQANQARQQAAGGAGMTISGVEWYEVAMEFGT